MDLEAMDDLERQAWFEDQPQAVQKKLLERAWKDRRAAVFIG